MENPDASDIGLFIWLFLVLFFEQMENALNFIAHGKILLTWMERYCGIFHQIFRKNDVFSSKLLNFEHFLSLNIIMNHYYFILDTI